MQEFDSPQKKEAGAKSDSQLIKVHNEPVIQEKELLLSHSNCSILSMESNDVEVGFLQVQRTLIDFAS